MSGLLAAYIALKGQCHAIWQLYKNLGVFASTELKKTNGLGLLFKTIWRYWNCFLLPVASDGKDGNGLKFEKNYQFFQILMLRLQKKILKNFIMVSPLW